MRALIVMSFMVLIAFHLLPFYVDLHGKFWGQLLDYKGSGNTPIGLTAGLMVVICALVAVASTSARKQTLRSCTVFLHPQIPVHVFNVLLLAGVIPWWFHEKSVRIDVDTTDLFDGWGYISGEACKLMMGLCLLPIARQSVWLDTAAVGYPEGIGFHRVTGWWCVAHVVIHAVCYTIREAMKAMSDYHINEAGQNRTHTHSGHHAVGEFESTEWHAAVMAIKVFYWPWATRLNNETGEPEPNTAGVFILCGLIGVLAAITLAVFALPRVRRARYDLFYLVHIPAAAFFIVMGAVHDFDMQVFVVPGLVAYFLDRTNFLHRTATSRYHRMTGRVRAMTGDWIRLDLVGDVHGVTFQGAHGTQFAYIRVPALSEESHAFSLADRSLSFMIKAKGDWTQRLHRLAMNQATYAVSTATTDTDPPVPTDAQLNNVVTDLMCEVDGVYGNVSPAWSAFSHVMFVGGGVGVIPWLPAMEDHRLHGDASVVQTMRLVWIGRDHTDLNAMRPYLPAEDTTVFLTRAGKKTVACHTACDSSAQPSLPLQDSCEMLEGSRLSGSEQSDSTIPEQNELGQGEARPWLFAFVSAISICMTQISHYYLRGTHSVYADYRRGCGEGCFEGKPTQTQYFLQKVLEVACSFGAIASTTVFARWASRGMGPLQCPCISSVSNAATSGRVQRRKLNELSSGVSIKFGRPDMAAVINAALAEVEAVSLRASSTRITRGLFVCVCGPDMLVQSCKDAVRDANRRHGGVIVGFHAEEPNW
jgi:hypothetical protein